MDNDEKTTNLLSNEIINLNPSNTFENFVVGESNQFTYTVAKAITEQKSPLYNPLFIHGDSGLGKTHLVQAIGDALKDTKKVLYISFETFLNEFTKSLKHNSMEHFRSKFRKCDILIIDDIQFIRNKIKTQDELFFTFNELDSLNKQIIFTADIHPKQIEGIENRIRDRFQMGLITKIEPLDVDLKLRIIQKIADINSIVLPRSVVNYISSITDSSAREITGIISKIQAYHILLRKDITLEFVKKTFEDSVSDDKTITMNDILEFVGKELNIKKSEICSKTRQRDVVKARRMSVYLSKRLTQHSMREMAAYFKFTDHSAVSHAVTKFKNDINEDSYLSAQVENIISFLRK